MGRISYPKPEERLVIKALSRAEARQMTARQAQRKRRSHRNTRACPLFAGHGRFTRRMYAGPRVHQPIDGFYNSTP
jgi:hypothetical protein